MLTSDGNDNVTSKLTMKKTPFDREDPKDLKKEVDIKLNTKTRSLIWYIG